MNVDPAELLGRVREAPADSDDARAAVLEAGQHELAATLSLLSRTDAPDSVRQLVIETLVPVMSASELLLLARFAGGQRQGVAERLGDLLANRSEPEAALVLIRVVAPRAPNARARIEAAAAQILAASPATGALHANLGSGLEDLRPGELGAAVVASSPGALADARDQISGRPAHRLALAEELALLDDEFRAGGTAEGERRMRTAVYAAVSVLGIPDEGDLATRANDWLFRLDDLDVLRALAPHLPDGAVQLYAERSLARQNRRGERADRVTFALDLLRDHASSKVQAATRDLVLECLDEESPDFRAGALRTLAVQASDLDAALRERVGATYSALAPSEQAAIAGDMRVLGGEATQLDDEALLRWAISAPDTEAEDRLATLLARWNSGTATTELAAQFIETAGALTARLEPERRTGALDDLVRAAAQWLRSKGARLADPLAALRSWEGFTSAAAARTPILVEELRAEQTRRTLIDVGRAGPNEIAQIASATVDDDVAERLLLPPLTSLASGEQAPQIVKAWSETSSTGIGQRRLIAAVVLALGQLKRNIEELSSNASSRELAALDARLRHVLDALAQAEADAAGNDVLIEQFGSLRRSIAGLLSDETVREPSERVQSWRLDAASRYPELIGAPDAGRQIVKLVGDPQDHAKELNAVLLELDQRAHNPRVLSETERADTAEDLRTLAAAAASADMLTVDGPLAAALARPELGQVLLAQWADAAADQADELLSEELRALADPALARTALPRVDALAGRQPSAAVVLHEANTLDAETLDAVWRGVSAALRERLKQHANLKRRALGRDAEAMERVAERMDPPMRAIESLLFSYFRFRSLLGQAGWLSLEDQLGSRVRRERVRPEIHEIQGDSTASTFVVRSLGLKAKGHVIARAVLEPEDAGAPESGDET